MRSRVITSWSIGVSESELAVLQDALEEEGPDDDDYWINPDEIDDLADAGGADNLANMLRFALERDFGFAGKADPPKPLPQVLRARSRVRGRRPAHRLWRPTCGYRRAHGWGADRAGRL